MTKDAPPRGPHPLPPWPVLPARRRWPLQVTAATRAIEVDAARALPPHTLMARAGRSTARLLQALAPHAAGTLALAGPGNNGGDATVAATVLHLPGRPSRIVLLADAARLPPDAAWALAQAQAAGVPVCGALDTVQHGEAVLDGLLGLGAARAPAGTLADAITRLNRSDAIVLAIDVPSGLDSDRGAVLGIEAIRATHTLALLTLKPGLFTAAGRDHAGRVWFDPLGVDFEDRPGPSALIGPLDARLGRLHAPHAAHKGRFGDVVVIGGARGMDGAVRLAARAALVAGAGRVYATPLDAAARGADPAWPELMHRPPDAWTTPPAVSSRTVVAGCGGGDAIGAALPPLLAHAARLVIDADALNAIAGDPGLQRALAARGARGRPTILTPHPLEAARLLGSDAAAVQADRFAACRALVGRFGATVVLKGSGTLVGSPDGRLWVNTTGNARLASAGTGDVLAGWIGGLWARVAGEAHTDDPGEGFAAEVAIAAAFVHGCAADSAGTDDAAERDDAPGLPLRAGELIDAMRRVRV